MSRNHPSSKLPAAVDIAAYVLFLAKQEPDPKFQKGLGAKKLQKILYYVQGWSLGRRDCVVFRDAIHAWRDGPVVREVRERYGDRFAASTDVEPELSDDTKAFIAAVWEDYKSLSQQELINRTHKEAPWLNARRGLRDYEPSDVEIGHASLREFFSQPDENALTTDELFRIADSPEAKPPASWYDDAEDLEPEQ
jgi:uncharacterized phage-associated protein